MKGRYKQVALKLETYERLKKLKMCPGQSFDHLMNALIDTVHKEQEK